MEGEVTKGENSRGGNEACSGKGELPVTVLHKYTAVGMYRKM